MAASDEAQQFELSSVISRAFEAISQNLLVFLGLTLLLAGPPTFAVQYWAETNARANLDPSTVLMWQTWTPVLIASLVSLITGAILQAALTRATVMHLSGEKPDFGKCLVTGLSMILPMIAIGILMGLGLMIGFLLLIVPGVFLWLAWSVTTPAYVQERGGIFAAFGRSFELTEGARWKILLLMIVIWIGLVILGIPLNMLAVAARGSDVPLMPALVQTGEGALNAMVLVAVQASIYVELRNVKEGVDPGDLESIFA